MYQFIILNCMSTDLKREIYTMTLLSLLLCIRTWVVFTAVSFKLTHNYLTLNVFDTQVFQRALT